jgi:hypothetical protein
VFSERLLNTGKVFSERLLNTGKAFSEESIMVMIIFIYNYLGRGRGRYFLPALKKMLRSIFFVYIEKCKRDILLCTLLFS